MEQLIWLLKWLLKAAIFFTLFAFALNNQHDASVHFFFGRQWRGPQVLIVLGAFTLGVMIGVLGMLPRWWKRRRARESQSPGARRDSAQPAVPGSTAHGL